MEFALLCATSTSVFSQAIKTCDSRAKSDDTDSMFLFQEKDGSLWITSLNNVSQQNILVPTTRFIADKSESFFVSGQAIVEFFKQFPDDEAICSYDGSILTIKGMVKDIEFKFPTTDASNFIPMNYIPQSTKVTIDAPSLASALHMTAFSTLPNTPSTATSPYVAVSLNIVGEVLTAQSSDDQRISIYETVITDVGMDTISVLLHRDTADNLSTLLTDVMEVTIEKGRRHIKFEWDNTIYTASLVCDVSEEFPDLEEIIDGDILATVNISRKEVLNSLKLAGLLAKDSYVTITASADGLGISSDEKDKGSSRNVIQAQSVTGEATTMIPYKNFLKGIEMIASPWITFEFREMLTFAGVSGLCITDEGYKHFIFPSIPN